MGKDRQLDNFPLCARLSTGYIASNVLIGGAKRTVPCNYAPAACKMISIVFSLQPLHDQRSNAYTGKERRRNPGLSKAQRRIKASSTPALLDRDVERWVVISKSAFAIDSILECIRPEMRYILRIREDAFRPLSECAYLRCCFLG